MIAVDIIALMDALKIDKAILAGYDWGARTANIIAALWPERCKAMVSVNGYLINNLERNKLPVPPRAEWGWWYQYYFATERGRAGYDANRREFARLIWKSNSPKWDFDDATFDRTAASFDNPDYVGIVIHNYRWRLSLAEGNPQYDDLEKRLAEAPVIAVPTITLDGDSDGVAPAWMEHPMPRNSPANARTELSRASVTICLKKPHRPLPKLSSKSTAIDMALRVARCE